MTTAVLLIKTRDTTWRPGICLKATLLLNICQYLIQELYLDELTQVSEGLTEKYISSISTTLSSKVSWDKVKRSSGQYSNNQINILKNKNNTVSSFEDISNTIASIYDTSSGSSYQLPFPRKESQ